MINVTTSRDNQLRLRLENLSKSNHDFWSFRGNSKREHTHGFFQYPAMTVPQLIGAVLNEVCFVYPEIEWIADPFAGSGTVLAESMLRGLNFVGIDVNPLAILLCKTKSGPFFSKAIDKKAKELNSRIEKDKLRRVEIDFPNIDKWFRIDVQLALSKLRRSIMAEPAIWARRFFWIALADAVRKTSNSRTSTFKLHIRPKIEIRNRTLNPIEVFKRTMYRNIDYLKLHSKKLSEIGHINRGYYLGQVITKLGDIRQLDSSRFQDCDLILTSPPYGDNATTVPYGQYSYLPLHWINVLDIDDGVKPDYLRSTHEIDSRSLGGSKHLNTFDYKMISERSSSFRKYLKSLKQEPIDRTKRVAAFVQDLDQSLETILKYLRPGGLLIWILGNRKVGGKRVPLDSIMMELLEYRDAKVLAIIKRAIPSKRMAIRNNFSETISVETILVMRKAI